MKVPYDVITFGEVLWDLFDDGEDTYRRFVGGGSSNVAVALAREGRRVAVVAGVGRDRFGDELIRRLDEFGVDTQFMVRLAERTALTFIARNANGEPHFTNYRQASANLALAARHITSSMARARWVHLGTCSLIANSNGMVEATRAFETHAARHRAYKSIDLNARPNLWANQNAALDELERLLPGCALIKASLGDLVAFGIGIGDLKDIAPDAVVLVTRGAEGATAYFGSSGRVSIAPTPTTPVDATGAGDAFIAGVLAHLVEKEAGPGSAAWGDPNLWTDALSRGHSLGVIAVSKLGGT
ncbi:carbohydrate kinase [Pendulispora brunnea]|uniref:Carbohydrate kinase n=1 Tax=Pendulispora brunnea TaxID=2905690 RepID=A0ABZ2KP50_9BACT